MFNKQLTIDNGQLTKQKISNVKSQMLNDSGQSLMELVIVIAVMVIVIGALTFATIASLRNAQFAKNQAQATKLAQEGLEWVRTGRDRNQLIGGSLGSVVSWNGTGNTDAIWDDKISGDKDTFCNYQSGNSSTSKQCYFKILPDGSLQYLISSITFPDLEQLVIADSPIFKRAVTLSDDASFASQKTVTAIVTWTDFSGPHESKLTTILRRI